MKKFLIVVILLIPIIVTMALNATGRFISYYSGDNPTDIEIRNSFNKIVGRDDIIRVDINDKGEFILVDVLPLMTQDDGINPPERDENSVGDIELERLQGTNKYYLRPLKVGMVKIILSANANLNVRRAVTFNITSDSIEYLAIYNKLGHDISTSSIYYPTESQQLYFDIFPIEALSHNLVSWRVTDGTSAVEISPNGYMTIHERGKTAVIRVMAKDKNQNLITRDIIVDTSNAVVKSSVVYVQADDISEVFINNNYALDPDNSETKKIADDRFEIVRTDPLTQEEVKATLTVVEVEEDDWDFSDRPTVLYTENGPHFLKVINLLTNKVEEKATFEISDPSMAQFDVSTGALVPLKAGSLQVTASFNKTQKTMIVEIKERVSSFELDLGIEDAKLGIQLTRKWGIYRFDEEGELTNQYRFGLYNKTANFDVEWSTSDPSIVSFELIPESQDIMLTFHEEGVGKSASIIADLMVNNRKVPGIKRSFEFNLMDTLDYINVYNFDEIKRIAFDEMYNVCLQSDIIADEILQLCLGVSFYGNGFLYDASSIPEIKLCTGAITIFRESWQWDRYAIKKIEGKHYRDTVNDEKNIKFEEMRMQNSPNIRDAADRGGCIVIVAVRRAKIDFKYMQIKNAERGLEVVWCRDVSIEGSILGDNVTYSVFMVYPEYPHYVFEGQRAQFRMKNNVLKHSEGPAVALSFGNTVSPEILEMGYMPEVYIEGFLDIYNWHTQETFERMFSKIVIQSLLSYTDMTQEAVNSIDKLIAPAFAEYFARPEVDHIYYWMNNKKYVSVGLMALGSVFKPEIELITCNDPNLSVMEIPMEDENGVPLSKSISAIARIVKLFIPVDKITNANNIVCYDFKGKDPSVKPGDPVPQDYELYDRLTGRAGG